MKQFNIWGKIVPLFIIVGLTLAVGCSTSTDSDPDPEPPTREPEPVERVGDKELTVSVIDRGDDTGLTGFNIEITGPVSASAENVSSSEFVLEDLESGEYTIAVTRDGYVEASITETFEVPEEESADFFAGATISLRELTPPVKVDNSEATTVKTGKPDAEDATEEEEVTLAIPANTFPAEVVNEDGSVDISVTRARPAEATRGESGGQLSESLILSPAAQLNDTVSITIPIRDVEGLEGVEYVLQPGNIPLTPDNNGNLIAKIAPGSISLADQIAEVIAFGKFDIEASNVELELELGFSSFRNLGNGQCEAAVNEAYEVDGVSNIPESITQYTPLRRSGVPGFSRQVNVDAVEEHILRVRARHVILSHTIFVGGEQRGSVNIPLNIVVTDVAQIACHNSGGNN